MCHTKWCYGECDECLADKKREKDHEEASALCPHRKECLFVTVSIKEDRCRTCGRVVNY